MSYRLGIDLGGTKIEAVIIDEQFQVVKRARVPTNRDDGYEAIIERIITSVSYTHLTLPTKRIV